MPARGDVLALKRRVGFGASHAAERFVVVQADSLNDALETTVVVPLDAAFSYYGGYPGAIRVPAARAGAARDQVAVLTAIASVDVSRFEQGAVARIDGDVLAEIDRILAVVVGLA